MTLYGDFWNLVIRLLVVVSPRPFSMQKMIDFGNAYAVEQQHWRMQWFWDNERKRMSMKNLSLTIWQLFSWEPGSFGLDGTVSTEVLV